MSKIKICEDKAELGSVAGSVILDAAKQAIATRNRFVVAFSGGSLPGIIAPFLIAKKKQVNWEKWFIVFSDERVLKDGDKDLNLVTCRKAFLDQVDIPPENIIGIDVSEGLNSSSDVETVANKFVYLHQRSEACFLCQ